MRAPGARSRSATGATRRTASSPRSPARSRAAAATGAVPAAAPDPPASGEPGVLEDLARAAGLDPGRADEVDILYATPDQPTLERALLTGAGLLSAIAHSGERAVREDDHGHRRTVPPADGSHLFQNKFRYLIAHAQLATHTLLLSPTYVSAGPRLRTLGNDEDGGLGAGGDWLPISLTKQKRDAVRPTAGTRGRIATKMNWRISLARERMGRAGGVSPGSLAS